MKQANLLLFLFKKSRTAIRFALSTPLLELTKLKFVTIITIV
jgi:hypothetical protein